MEELKVMVRGEDPSGPRSDQSRKRRASAITVRIQRRSSGAAPSLATQAVAPLRTSVSQVASSRPFPDPEGSLLLVHNGAEEREGFVRAARLAGFEVLQAGNPEEAIKLQQEPDFHLDLLLMIDHPPSSSPSAALIRKSLEIRPGLRILVMMDSGREEEMRASYAAGAASIIIIQDTSMERFTTFLKQSLSVAREGQRHALRRREREGRHASDSPARRGIRKIRLWVRGPGGARRRAGLAAIAAVTVALVIGMGLAFSLEESYRAGDRNEAMTNRILEGINRSRGSNHQQEAAIQYEQTWQQIELSREANEATRRYYQDHLRELRWQNVSRSSVPSDPVPLPIPDRALYFRR